MKNKNLISIVVFVLLSSSTLIWVFNNYLNYDIKEKNEQLIDSYLFELTNLVEKNKNLILTASVLLAKDPSIKKCLKTKNRSTCLKYLIKAKNDLLNTYILEDFKIHIHDKDLRSFYRLWSQDKENDKLGSFRHSLKIVKEQKKPFSTIEVGRYSMLIRAISPILDKDKYLGSIEAITNFNSIIKHFEKKGIKLYILMNKDLESIASEVKFTKNQKLKNYIVLNKTNEDLFFLNEIELKGTSYKKINYSYLVNTPIYDIHRKIIGFYVLKIYI